MLGLKIEKSVEDKKPEILSLDEIKKLIRLAKEQNHPWYQIYVVALLTGMRSGELHALKWSDVELDTKRIIVSRSYNPRFKIEKETKAGYWRTVPVSPELQSFLEGLKIRDGSSLYVLPRFRDWDKGEQARVLKTFCIGNGLPVVKFHTLRACFATQLLAQKVAPATVMKICGWKDLNTMQRYIRLAGIDEAGATDGLRILSGSEAMAEVVNLLDFKANREDR